MQKKVTVTLLGLMVLGGVLWSQPQYADFVVKGLFQIGQAAEFVLVPESGAPSGACSINGQVETFGGALYVCDTTWQQVVGGESSGLSCEPVRTDSTHIDIASCGFMFPGMATPEDISSIDVAVTNSNTGIIFGWVDADGEFKVGTTGGVTVTCTNCTDEGTIADFPHSAKEIFKWAVTTGSLAADDGSQDFRRTINGPLYLIDGSTTTVNRTGTQVSLEVNPDAITASVDPITDINIVEEFMGSTAITGTHGWTGIVQTAGSIAGIVGVANHPGIMRITSAAATNNGYILVLRTANTISPVSPLSSLAGWYADFIFRTDPSVVTNYSLRIGFANVDGGFSTEGINLVFDTAIGTNFLFRTCTGATCGTDVDSGLAIAANTWYKLRISSDVAGTIDFALTPAGGSTVTGSKSVNIPTIAMMPAFWMRTLEAAVKNLDIDFFQWHQEVTR